MIVSINQTVKNKIAKWDKESWVKLNKYYRNYELTQEDFLKAIKHGYSFCTAQLKVGDNTYCRKIQENFISSQVVAIDIDNKDKNGKFEDERYWSYVDAINDPELKELSAFIYTTPSHRWEHDRFRIVYVLEEKISDPVKYKEIVKALNHRFKGDMSCTAICQNFFGNSKAFYEFFGNVLSKEEIVRTLVEFSNPNEPDFSHLIPDS